MIHAPEIEINLYENLIGVVCKGESHLPFNFHGFRILPDGKKYPLQFSTIEKMKQNTEYLFEFQCHIGETLQLVLPPDTKLGQGFDAKSNVIDIISYLQN